MRMLRHFYRGRAACQRQAQNLKCGLRGIEPARQAPDALKTPGGFENRPKIGPARAKAGSPRFISAQSVESLKLAQAFQNLFRRARGGKPSDFNLQAQTVEFIFNFLSVQNV